jgi:co-chaperonin GroES (HSP10)
MFKPTQDYILVKPIERKKSHVVEVVSYEKYNRGMVVAVGPGERMKRNGEETGAIREMCVKPGDFVTYVDLDHIYPKYRITSCSSASWRPWSAGKCSGSWCSCRLGRPSRPMPRPVPAVVHGPQRH